jgi:hypothetical protein
MRGKENTYASEFHKTFIARHKAMIMGTKTHGGPFQKAGFPDYLYWFNRLGAQSEFDTHYDFAAIEFKYIRGGKVPKKLFRPESHLRPVQRQFLVRLNDFGYLAMQVSFVEFGPRCRIIVFNRPRANGDSIEIKADAMKLFTQMPEKERDSVFHKDAEFDYFFAYRSPNDPHYPWARIIDGMRRLV